MIKDLTDIFRKGILNSADYNPKIIEHQLENLPNICLWYDDWHFSWYYIYIKDEKGVEEDCGFLSRHFPVALLMENCPDNVRNLLKNNNIFTNNFSRRCSCDEEILKQYASEELSIVDDRKLLDGRISFDSKEFEIICSYYYTDPYDFDFYILLD
ncbi:MAG: hypothetical protein K2K14_06605 [Ruminococcus sp.]|nr:hypothetical protein [Ruminococcus sp.]